MTVRNVNQFNEYVDNTPIPPVDDPDAETWIRNPSWLTMPSQTEHSGQRLVKLVAVDYGSSFVGFTLRCAEVGAVYTIDWGDGNVETYTTVSGNEQVAFTHTYDYTNSNLDGTNAPATITSSVINRNSHGYPDGYKLFLNEITGPTNIYEYRQYYVVNSSTNSFQISETKGGSPITINANGTTNLLPYKQALIDITCDGGGINYMVIYPHTNTGLFTGGDANYSYDQCYLQIDVNTPQLTSWAAFRGSTQDQRYLQYPRLEIVNAHNLGYLTTLTYFFTSCKNLRSLEVFRIPNTMWSCSGLFSGCTKLTHIPEDFDTSNLVYADRMFWNCHSLKRIPKFNFPKLVYGYGMFQYCYSLERIPDIDFSNSTDFSFMFGNCYNLQFCDGIFGKPSRTDGMFQNCYKLRKIPSSLSFEKAVYTRGMFTDCRSLEGDVKIYAPEARDLYAFFQNTAIVRAEIYAPKCDNGQNLFYSVRTLKKVKARFDNLKTARSMFYVCRALEDVSELDIRGDNLIDCASMFNNCWAIGDTLPYFDTSNVEDASAMFQSLGTTRKIPEYVFTNKLRIASYMFADCQMLEKVPTSIDFSNVTTAVGLFQNLNMIKEYPWAIINMPKVTDINAMFYRNYILRYVPKLILGNCTGAYQAFRECQLVEQIPVVENFSTVQNIGHTFYNCRNLKEIPAVDMSGVTNIDVNTFQLLYSLKKFKALNLGAGGINTTVYARYGQLSSSEIDSFFTNLADISSGPSRSIDFRNQTGISGANSTIATSKGWTVLV